MTALLIPVALCPKILTASSFSEGNKGTGDYNSLVRNFRLPNFYLSLVVKFLIFFEFAFFFILNFAHKLRLLLIILLYRSVSNSHKLQRRTIFATDIQLVLIIMLFIFMFNLLEST